MLPKGFKPCALKLVQSDGTAEMAPKPKNRKGGRFRRRFPATFLPSRKKNNVP